jgi:type II secretory pathway pseudopilin PulG
MRRSAFTLIEMIVILAIMMTVMAMLLPGIALMQRKSDIYSTSNVLQSVHAIQFRNARQFGSAGLVYGYTLNFSTVLSGSTRSANFIQPWIIINGVVTYNAPGNDLKADIGKQMFWNGTSIEFVDLLRPAGTVLIDGVDKTPTAAASYINIGFSPRHGFVMAGRESSGTPTFNLAMISDPTEVHQDVEMQLWSTKSKRPSLNVRITSTGIINVDGNL